MGTSRVTIADVARRAGVSPTAVSFAFHNPDQLGAETAQRIMAAVRELGYAPSPFARALVSRQVGVLGVLVPQGIGAIFENPFFAAFLQGVGTACAEQDRSMLVVGSPVDGTLEDVIARAPVDGFIIVGLNEGYREIEPLRRRGVPFVIVDGDSETVSSVNVDDEGGASRAAAHLLAAGHRDVLVLTFETPYGHLDDPLHGVGGRRLRGYQQAFRDARVAWRDQWLIPSVASVEGGRQGFLTALRSGLRPTAVLAVSDAIAAGALAAAARAEFRVPEELEIIGFDDTILAELSCPPLTTVRQPIVDKGRIAAELLLDALADRGSAERIVLPTELILRGTTRAPEIRTRSRHNKHRRTDDGV